MKQYGFTLVELLIVVAILAFLTLAAAPLSGAWVQDADLLKVEGEFTQAIGRAKASALRNQRAALASEPVTAICVSNTKVLTVLEGTQATAPNCGTPAGTQLWTAQLDSDVSVTSSGNAVSCMCFDNRGLLTTSSCAGCLTQSTFTLSAGSKNETVYIY